MYVLHYNIGIVIVVAFTRMASSAVRCDNILRRRSANDGDTSSDLAGTRSTMAVIFDGFKD